VAYRVELLPSAAKELASLPREVQRRLARRIDLLAENPRPQGSKMLHGPDKLVRSRVGDYRILYRIEATRRVVSIVKIGHRASVYRRR
jgi:mRNA interferase RelE/StbE